MTKILITAGRQKSEEEKKNVKKVKPKGRKKLKKKHFILKHESPKNANKPHFLQKITMTAATAAAEEEEYSERPSDWALTLNKEIF